MLALVLLAIVAVTKAEDETVTSIKACLKEECAEDRIECVADVLGHDASEAAAKVKEVLKEAGHDVKDFFETNGKKVKEFLQEKQKFFEEKFESFKEKAGNFFSKLKEKLTPEKSEFIKNAEACVADNPDDSAKRTGCIAAVVRNSVKKTDEEIKEKLASLLAKSKKVNRALKDDWENFKTNLKNSGVVRGIVDGLNQIKQDIEGWFASFKEEYKAKRQKRQVVAIDFDGCIFDNPGKYESSECIVKQILAKTRYGKGSIEDTINHLMTAPETRPTLLNQLNEFNRALTQHYLSNKLVEDALNQQREALLAGGA